MTIEAILAGVAVADIEAAIPWYERLLGKKYDERPMKEAASWQLASGGGIQLILDAARAGKSMVTISVADIDGLVADLRGRGVDTRASEPGGPFRLAQLLDLEGNLLTFAEDQRKR